ncbi:AtpZ/AtpI family protein [bacterium]|nr:AtpZ/AtpI family protein [bacterium]
MNRGPKKDSPLKEFGLYGSLGITMVILTAGGYYLGYLADEKFGTSPYLSMIGLFLGIGAGFYQLYKVSVGKK